MENKKREPWRIAVGIVSILAIVIMWTIKGINSTAITEDMLPIAATSAPFLWQK